jgi:hypothetical protein
LSYTRVIRYPAIVIYSLQHYPTQHTALYTREQRFVWQMRHGTRKITQYTKVSLQHLQVRYGTLIHQSWCIPARGAAGTPSGDLISIGSQDIPSFCSKLSGSIRRARERKAASGDRASVGVRQFTHIHGDQGGFETALRRIICGWGGGGGYDALFTALDEHARAAQSGECGL